MNHPPTDSETEKSDAARREEDILSFWQEHNIFEKSLAKPSPKGEFVFYDGPPFATGLPHYGSLLSSIIKDVIPRYKTMRGYHVRRRWGWDCHGLPIENMIEKELGLKSKKDIEELGVEKFNEACRASVLRYVDEWKEYVEKVGRWVDYGNSYKTMDVTYMESVWWVLKEMHDKDLLYEGRKVLLYCPHCETPLAKAEIAMDNSYRDVTDDAVTVKFKVKEPKKHGLPDNTYLLAWTTTPWTLPGNVALAVGPEIMYQQTQKGGETLIYAGARDIVPDGEHVSTVLGDELVGLEYEPLYEIDAVGNSGKKAWYVAPADFVTTEEGTGIVHTAVIYGEDDYQLGLSLDLPIVPLLDASGKFNEMAPEFIQGVYLKEAEAVIVKDLSERKILFASEGYTHSYPHCHRCGTPLIYNALVSWFVDIQKVKKRLLRLNRKINWYPGHLKYGRFHNIMESAPDWTISRNRYWASPLPVWKCETCSEIKVIGSVEELKKNTKTSGNTYFIMRHGEAEHDKAGVRNSTNSPSFHLTERGRSETDTQAEKLKHIGITRVFASPLTRALETAEIVAKKIGIPSNDIIIDERVRELGFGELHNQPREKWGELLSGKTPVEMLVTHAPGGESYEEARARLGTFLYDLETQYSNEVILIVSHGIAVELLPTVVEGLSNIAAMEKILTDRYGNGELRKLDFVPLPHNTNYELDLHRPYIDEVHLTCVCGSVMHRIPEVVDGWMEAASMPFAEYHYPFENKQTFKNRFPGDFIAEYIAQTRTWFYYMHAISGILFRKPSFKNVVTTGTILAEDGSKMSKSKGNYTNPLENIARYGADPLRYYLMTSVVMQAEDLRFTDNDLREAHNRTLNILWNVFKFYGTYADEYDGSTKPSATSSVLDRWIVTQLYELIKTVTEGLERFDTVTAGRPIRDFVTDFSTWYIRRSRERFKGDDENDKQAALATTRYVLLELVKVMAPFTPFIAEDIYRRVGGLLESVHLEEWPRGGRVDENILTEMAEVRRVVSLALESRMTAGVKVRQPLARLTIRNPKSIIQGNDELLGLIKDEINVKEVLFEDATGWEVELETTITPELQAEGQAREFIRAVQNLRKKAGFVPSDTVVLEVNTDALGKKLITTFKDDIQKAALLRDIQFTQGTGEKIVVDAMTFNVAVKK